MENKMETILKGYENKIKEGIFLKFELYIEKAQHIPEEEKNRIIPRIYEFAQELERMENAENTIK
jgi:hypothetical protein